jgi:tRNA dimethylallyltransferase
VLGWALDVRPIIAIVGPTATGKTAVGAAVARAVHGEVISADSMAVYRGMDIGTAKPTVAERESVRFHLIDVADPDERYNVALFKDQAVSALQDIGRRGKWPLLVGGTGLYVRVLLEGFGLTATAADPAVRARLMREAGEGATHALHERLRRVDPTAADRIHPNDRVRIVRALEVYEVSGRPMSEQQTADAAARTPREALRFGLTAPRDELYSRIDRRVDEMVAYGLVAEVDGLLREGYRPDSPPLQSLGYKEIVAHLEGRSSLEQAVEEIKQNTRRFAKRQITWFRPDGEMVWIDIHGKSVPEVAHEILKRLPT